MKKLVTQLRRSGVFRVATSTSAAGGAEENTDADTESVDIALVSLANKNTAPDDIVSDLLTAQERGKEQVITNVKQQLVEKTVGFHDTLKTSVQFSYKIAITS